MSSVSSINLNKATVWNNHTGGIVYDAELLSKHQLAPAHSLFTPEFWRARYSASAQTGGRGQVHFINEGDCHWVLRHYRRGGLIGKLVTDQYLWLGQNNTRAFREWHLLAQLHAQHLPVPAPVAARYQRRGLFYQADLITVAIPQARTLAQRLATDVLDARIWQQLGRVLARFHAAGVQHADLNAHNIVFAEDHSIHVLDFDRGRIREVNKRWIDVVMQRLLRSLEKLQQQRKIRFEMSEWSVLVEAHNAALMTAIRSGSNPDSPCSSP